MNFVDRQCANSTKGAVHGALLTIAGFCGAYNVAAYRSRRERHLAWNAVFYLGIALVEVYQIGRHCERGTNHEG